LDSFRRCGAGDQAGSWSSTLFSFTWKALPSIFSSFGLSLDRCGGVAHEWMGSPSSTLFSFTWKDFPSRISGPGLSPDCWVGALDFARCYRSLRAPSPSRPPLLALLEDNVRRFGGFPGKSGPLRYSIAALIYRFTSWLTSPPRRAAAHPKRHIAS
jgi:hypothetical protein